MKYDINTNIVLQYLRRQKAKTLKIVFLGVMANVLTISIPVSIGKYYRLVFHLHSRRVKVFNFIPEQIWNTVPKFLIVFFTLIILRFFFFFWYQYLIKKEGEFFVKSIKDYLFEYQLKIKYAIYQEKGIGKYLLRYSGDINSLKNLYLKGSIKIFVDAIMLAVALFWLSVLNVKGAVVVVVASVLCYVLIRIVNKKIEYYSINKRNKSAGQLSFVSRALHSILTIKVFNKQDVELKKYQKKSKAVKNAAIIYHKWFIINKGLIAFMQYGVLGMVLYVFYLEDTVQNQSALISFILLYVTILPVVRRLFFIETVYKLGNISLVKLNNIIQSEKEFINKGEQLIVKNPRIKFVKVQFNQHQPISFVSEKMNFSVLKLPRGVDSLDLITALTRLEDAYSGRIFINDVDLKVYSPKSLRENIGIVSRKVPLLGRTVYEAITESRSSKTKKEVTRLFDTIQKQFLGEIKLAIDDKIGENGSNISELHYELLCFVRGILTKRKILIVDDFSLLEPQHSAVFKSSLENYEGTVIKLK